jgi:serine/threonine protein kinase
MDLSKRFEIHQVLGEGSFSKIFSAYDHKNRLKVALKVEKEDKHKKILKFEYDILKSLQGLPHIPTLYDFIDNSRGGVVFGTTNDPAHSTKNNIFNSTGEGLNFIVMELLGKNVAIYKKSVEGFDNITAYDILIQMLDAIEQLHDKGYIHRDVKPTNFVVREKNLGNNRPINCKFRGGYNDPATSANGNFICPVDVYMVDYGLAKVHLDRYARPLPPRVNTDFRGTLTYASLNAHYKKELSRRDDLWSFFFMVLDLLNEILPWRSCKDDKDDIKKVKEECLANPEKKLLLTTTKGKKEILDLLNHIKSLAYADRPNYNFIRTKLNELKMQEISKFKKMYNSSTLMNSGCNLDNLNNLNNLGNLNNLNNINNLNSLNNLNNFNLQGNLNNQNLPNYNPDGSFNNVAGCQFPNFSNNNINKLMFLNNIGNFGNLTNLSNMNNINNMNNLNNLNLNSLNNLNGNLNTNLTNLNVINKTSTNSNLNYEFPIASEGSPTKENFLLNHLMMNNNLLMGNFTHNTNQENGNKKNLRTKNVSQNYLKLTELQQGGGIPSSSNYVQAGSNLQGNNGNAQPCQTTGQTANCNTNINNLPPTPTNYIDSMKKIYLESLLNNLNASMNPIIDVMNTQNNFNNLSTNLNFEENLNLNNLYNYNNNTTNLNPFNRFPDLNTLTNLAYMNGNNMGKNFTNYNQFNGINTLNPFNSLNNVNNMNNMSGISNLISNLPVNSSSNNNIVPASSNSNQCIPQCDKDSFISRKRKRENISSLTDEIACESKNSKTNNIPVSNVSNVGNLSNGPTNPQQNQIFIINQYNKNQMTELESKLLDYLLKQSEQKKEGCDLKLNLNYIEKIEKIDEKIQVAEEKNPIVNLLNPNPAPNSNPTNNTTKKSNRLNRSSEYNINNDKLLINSITSKLKPPTPTVTCRDKNNTSMNFNTMSLPLHNQSDFLANVNNLLQNMSNNDINNIISNLMEKNSVNNLATNNTRQPQRGRHMNAQVSSEMQTNVELLNLDLAVNTHNNYKKGIFKIEKRKK